MKDERCCYCQLCGEFFLSSTPLEEALAESQSLWGTRDLEKLAVICGDCFDKHRISGLEKIAGAPAHTH